jgi:hypothetical protein
MILRGHELYVRVGDSRIAMDRLRDAVGETAATHHSSGCAYCVVLWPDETFRPPEQLSAALSRDLAEELRHVWAQRLLVVDSKQPQLSAIDAAYTVARHFQLPGWSA